MFVIWRKSKQITLCKEVNRIEVYNRKISQRKVCWKTLQSYSAIRRWASLEIFIVVKFYDQFQAKNAFYLQSPQ